MLTCGCNHMVKIDQVIDVGHTILCPACARKLKKKIEEQLHDEDSKNQDS